MFGLQRGRGLVGRACVRLCLAQGIPLAVIDTYVFPTTATAGLTQGNRTSSRKLQTHTTSESVVELSIVGAIVERTVGLVGLLQHRDQRGHLGRAGPVCAQQVLQPRRIQSFLLVDNQFCGLLTRDANGLLQLIETPYLNLGGLKTEGVDLQLGWAFDIGDLGTLHFNTGVGYLLEYSVQTLPGSAFQEFTDTNTIAANHTVSNTFPEWKALRRWV